MTSRLGAFSLPSSSSSSSSSNERCSTPSPYAPSERRIAPIRTPGGFGDRFLREESGRRDHSEATVRELLLLHQPELLRILRLEAERVEAQVPRIITLLQCPLCFGFLRVKLGLQHRQ